MGKAPARVCGAASVEGARGRPCDAHHGKPLAARQQSVAHIVGVILFGMTTSVPQLEFVLRRVSQDVNVPILVFHPPEKEVVVQTLLAQLRTENVLLNGSRAVGTMPRSLTYCSFNRYLLSTEYVRAIQRHAPAGVTHVLKFSSDSSTCGQNIEALHTASKFDYCGPMWSNHRVGNSGFSVWRVDTTLRVYEAHEPEVLLREKLNRAWQQIDSEGIQLLPEMGLIKRVLGSTLQSHSLNNESRCWSPDVVFSAWCTGRPTDYGDAEIRRDRDKPHVPCGLCPPHVAARFAVETLHSTRGIEPFGFHRPWGRVNRSFGTASARRWQPWTSEARSNPCFSALSGVFNLWFEAAPERGYLNRGKN